MHRFIPLLLILVLLTGCAAQESLSPPEEALPAELPEQSIPFLELTRESDAVSEYSLPLDVTGFLPLGDDLLFFRGQETTRLILVDPVSGQNIAAYAPGLMLTSQNATVQRLAEGISYFNGQSGETVLLDPMLQEIRRIRVPEDLTGMPLLSRDGNTLYYCTPSALRALDLSTGIDRVLREASYPVQGLSGLLLEDSVLRLSITEADGTWRTLFLSAENGQLLQACDGNLLPEAWGSRYFLWQQSGSRNTLLFGTAGETPMVLNPVDVPEDCFFLGSRILTATGTSAGLALNLYDLDSGIRVSHWDGLPPDAVLWDILQDRNGDIWLLCDQQNVPRLYRWNPDATKTGDSISCIYPRHTRQEPDLDALAACSLYARELSLRHGVEILVYTDAVELQPWDYELEYEYDARILAQELEQLDQRLSHYPASFLQRLAEKFDGIRICLVRSIRGTPESGSVDIANGIQFWDGYTACIVLASGHDTERALYHELCHLMDTVVLTESTAYDRWDMLNPSGFRYANAYDHSLKAADWLQAGWESFLDDYSLSYPKEDRARILEYAMTEGHADRFLSPYLQAKLRLLCTGIREAFGLEAVPEAFLWEQYLEIPLAATP